jgi:hypothetical protein
MLDTPPGRGLRAWGLAGMTAVGRDLSVGQVGDASTPPLPGALPAGAPCHFERTTAGLVTA